MLLILSLLLSWLFSGSKAPSVDKFAQFSASVVESSGQDRSNNNPNCNTKAIMPVQTARISGENTFSAPSVRSTNSGRRSQVSQKSPFRIIKVGKIIDKHNFYFYQTELHQFESGIHSLGRYIHAICHLLI